MKNDEVLNSCEVQMEMPARLRDAQRIMYVLAVISGIGSLLMSIGLLWEIMRMTSGRASGSDVMGVVVGACLCVALALGFYFGATTLKNGNRLIATLIAVLFLPGLPIGTIIGVILLMRLYSAKNNEWLASVQKQP